VCVTITVKNEITIITAPNDFFNLWAKFIIIHYNRKLIDPNTRKKFNESKRFDFYPMFYLPLRVLGAIGEPKRRGVQEVGHLPS
jgi:hypothetical protein